MGHVLIHDRWLFDKKPDTPYSEPSEQHKKEAAEWLIRAAQGGWPRAQFDLGYAYKTGSLTAYGIPKNPEEAIKWYKKASEGPTDYQCGASCAERSLAFAYFKGDGVPCDPDEGLKWLRKAISRHDDVSGDLYPLILAPREHLKELIENPDLLAKWKMKYTASSADQASSEDERLIAQAYLSGKECPKDPQKAERYYLRSALHGDSSSAHMVSYIYRHGGEFLSKDIIESLAWGYVSKLEGETMDCYWSREDEESLPPEAIKIAHARALMIKKVIDDDHKKKISDLSWMKPLSVTWEDMPTTVAPSPVPAASAIPVRTPIPVATPIPLHSQQVAPIQVKDAVTTFNVEKADRELNLVYQKKISRLNKGERDRLKHDEIAWIKRKEELLSSNPTNSNTLALSLIKERIKILQAQ
jgi:TPR repeat protein